MSSLHLNLWGKSPTVQLLGHRAGLFLTLRNLHTVFQSGCTSSHSHQQCKRVPLSPHPLQHLLFPVLLIFTVLSGVRWDLLVVLICISLMARGAEHFLMCMLAMSMSSSVRFLFMCFAHFMIGLFVSWVLSLISSFFLRFHLFIHERHREREAETQAEGEAGSMQGARCGTSSR